MSVRVVESCGEVPAARPPALHVQAPTFGSLLVVVSLQ
jgi:hypothetical protein